MSLFGGSNPVSTFGRPAQPAATPAEQDIEVTQPPTDGISSLSFSPVADFLAASCWDNNVRIYGVEQNGSTQAKAMYSHEGPVLDVTWSRDGTKILSAGADKAARMFDVSTGQSSQIAAHDAPIKNLRFVDQQGGILVTGSWDKTLKYWDLRQANPIAVAQLAERCYSMDAVWPYVVVGTAERKIQVFDMSQNPTNAIINMESPLKWQTRVVSCIQRADQPGLPPVQPGFAVGSVEGRVAFQYIKDEHKGSNFSFKCHRKDPGPGQSREPHQVFSVNDIRFHPIQGTFSTCGSDGTINFWDKDSKTRLKSFDNKGGPISASAFNSTGSIFAYSVSYDWHKGYSFANPPNTPNKIYLHATKDDEVKRRPKKT